MKVICISMRIRKNQQHRRKHLFSQFLIQI